MTITEQILALSTENIANANNTWEGWKEFFAQRGVTVVDDDSGYGNRDILNFRQAANGLMKCTVKQEIEQTC
jgi:hypothetical protein